jgi:hypothetical protein
MFRSTTIPGGITCIHMTAKATTGDPRTPSVAAVARARVANRGSAKTFVGNRGSGHHKSRAATLGGTSATQVEAASVADFTSQSTSRQASSNRLARDAATRLGTARGWNFN